MALVAMMVLVGGITRLTESGLSIVEWKLLSGTLPPLSQQAWESEFAAYQQTPEYQKVNTGMLLDEFKQIFWLEYLHRLLGRTTGLALVIPFVVFAIRKHMDAVLTKRMAAACLLVAAQGTVGWLMVKSGLVDDPRVSPIRLALHLSLAFILFGLLFWTRLQLTHAHRLTGITSNAPLHIRLLLLLVSIQVVLGAFVAGTDAGLSYNSFPLMDGDWIPDGLLTLSPWTRNLIENVTMIQFQHRMTAYLVSFAIIVFVISQWKQADRATRYLLVWLMDALLIQFSLGVMTLIYHVPLALASAHQMGALLLWSICIRLCFALPLKPSQNNTTLPMPRENIP